MAIAEKMPNAMWFNHKYYNFKCVCLSLDEQLWAVCGILTDFGCHHSDIVLNSCLSVQVFISGNGSLNGVNIKTAVRLCVPFQRIPAEIRAAHMSPPEREIQATVVGWLLSSKDPDMKNAHTSAVGYSKQNFFVTGEPITNSKVRVLLFFKHKEQHLVFGGSGSGLQELWPTQITGVFAFKPGQLVKAPMHNCCTLMFLLSFKKSTLFIRDFQQDHFKNNSWMFFDVWRGQFVWNNACLIF